jgi:glucose/arabinose dehydrogenase
VDTSNIFIFSLFLIFAFFLIPTLISNIVSVGYDYAYAATSSGPTVTAKTTIKSSNDPVIDDPNLKTEVVFRGDKFPSTMAFLGPNDILLLQKDSGTVERIVNGNKLSNPLLHLNVSAEAERGMLGIAIAKHNNGPTYVFLYYTKAGSGSSHSPSNVLYRYELVNDELIDPKLLLSFPVGSAPFHNGGKVIIGPDNNVYVTSGDLFVHRTKAQNFENGTDPDGSGGILRVTQDGKPVGKGILGDKFPLNLYYAYGIRNSFGIDFDPVSRTLWDTENGPNFADEINLVEPGFNSGWVKVQGIWKVARSDEGKPPTNQGQIATHPETNLLSFGGKGKYRTPEFTWQETVGITAVKFLNSTKLGEKYKNHMFVGDFNNGILYHFQLNKQRNGLIMSGALADKINSYRDCDFAFKCTVNSSIGWQNINRSFQISTNTTNKNAWSWKDGEEMTVAPGEGYSLITHMKLNNYVIASHVALLGYNESSKDWYPLTTQCPTGTNGPLEWKEFRCNITIPANTTKIKPVFNAGWSSEEGKEAVTLFDAIHLDKFTSCTNEICTTVHSENNATLNFDFERPNQFGYGFGRITDLQIGPDGYLYVLSLQADSPVYPGQIFPYGAAAKETIYRIILARK